MVSEVSRYCCQTCGMIYRLRSTAEECEAIPYHDEPQYKLGEEIEVMVEQDHGTVFVQIERFKAKIIFIGRFINEKKQHQNYYVVQHPTLEEERTVIYGSPNYGAPLLYSPRSYKSVVGYHKVRIQHAEEDKVLRPLF